MKNRPKIKHLGTLLAANDTNHAHFTKRPKLVGAASLHDGLQNGGGPVESKLPGLLYRAADQQITETDVLQSFLHDDLATFIYDRLKRRPMVLPVVVEV